MTHIVQTTEGCLVAGNPSDRECKNEPITEAQAEARCAAANAKAEELGIKARYEVKPA